MSKKRQEKAKAKHQRHNHPTVTNKTTNTAAATVTERKKQSVQRVVQATKSPQQPMVVHPSIKLKQAAPAWQTLYNQISKSI